MSKFTHPNLKAIQVPPVNSERSSVSSAPQAWTSGEREQEAYQTLRGTDQRGEGRSFAS